MYHLITGGSSGLGFEIAKALVKHGESVIILGRDITKLELAQERLSDINGEVGVIAYAVNIASESEVNALLEVLDAPVKTLFNVAGTTHFGKVQDVTRSDIDNVLRSNLVGLMLMTSKTVGYMLDQPVQGQRIVSVLSTAALKGKKNEAIYNASKWGARGYLESLRDELTSNKIEVINIFPGGMNTPFWKNSASGYDVEHFMDPADVAEHVVRLALDHRVFVNDITIGRPK